MSVPPFRDLVKTLMLSNLAYMNQLEEITKVIGYPQVKFICGSLQGQDTQLYVLFEERNAFVIFRGTENAKDMINDAEAVRLESVSFDSQIKVHRGFHLQYKAIEVELTSYLDAHQTQYDKLVFTGHSLGGALATIATVYYHNKTEHKKRVQVQTYGCPRVGNAAFSEYYKSCIASADDHFRVFNKDDPAAKFPSQTEILNKDIYIHVPGNSLCLVGGVPTTYEVSQSDNNLSVPLNFFRYLDQHHTALYMERLLQLADPSIVPTCLSPANNVVSSVVDNSSNDSGETIPAGMTGMTGSNSVSGKAAAELKEGTEQAVQGTSVFPGDVGIEVQQPAASSSSTVTGDKDGSSEAAVDTIDVPAGTPPVAGGCAIC